MPGLWYAGGSFGWDRPGADVYSGESGDTAYDALYLTLKATHQVPEGTEGEAAPLQGLYASLTAPRGFSFDPRRVVEQKDYYIGTLEAGESFPVELVLYPTFLGSFPGSLQLSCTVRGGDGTALGALSYPIPLSRLSAGDGHAGAPGPRRSRRCST